MGESKIAHMLAKSATKTHWDTPSVLPCQPTFPSGYEASVSDDEFGSLLQNTGPIADVIAELAAIRCADGARIGLHGTTGLNAVVAETLRITAPGSVVLHAANCHHSVSASLKHRHLRARVLPARRLGPDVVLPPTAGDVALQLDRQRRLGNVVSAVVITSPSYEGSVADIRAIAGVCRAFGALLWVDEAWGAHFGRANGLRPSAIEEGADIVCQSTHKTAGAPQQGSLLLFNDGVVDRAALQAAYEETGTTSGSRQLAAGVEHAVRRLAGDPSLLAGLASTVTRLRGLLTAQFGDAVDFIEESAGCLPEVSAVCPIRTTIDIRGFGIAPKEVARRLAGEGIVVEKASSSALTFLAVFGQPAGAAERTVAALHAILSGAALRGGAASDQIVVSSWPVPGDPVLEAYEVARFASDIKFVKPSQSIGCVAARAIEPYPPGIPLLSPGSHIGEEQAQLLEQLLSQGHRVLGVDRAGDIPVLSALGRPLAAA